MPTASTDVMTAAKKSGSPFVFLLGALSMFGPLSIDLNLPAFSDMAVSLQVDMLQVQQTLTFYFVAFGTMILFHGAISDAFGRRHVLLFWLGVYVIASLGCAFSQSIESIWAFRILQGISAGAGVVNVRAIICDLYSNHEATRLLASVTMVFSLGPAIAPIIGGWIVTLLNWRAVFLFMFLYVGILLWFCYCSLPESLPATARVPFSLKPLFKSYREVFSAPLFYLVGGVVTCNFAGLWIYLAAAPVFLPQQLGLGPRQFAWLYFPEVAGMFFGSWVAKRFSVIGSASSSTIISAAPTLRESVGRFTGAAQVLMGFGIVGAACLINVLYCAFYSPALPWSVMPLFFYSFGIVLIAPRANLLVLDLFPENRGITSSCQVFFQTLSIAFIAGVIAPLLSHSALWLAAAQAGLTLISLALWVNCRLYPMRQNRQFSI